METKEMPHDYEVEKLVLGTLMTERDALGEVRDLLTPDTFYGKLHRDIYCAILQVDARGERPDMITVMNELRKTQDFQPYDFALVAGCLTYDVRQHAALLHDKEKRRRFFEIGQYLTQNCFSEATDIVDVLSEAREKMDGVLQAANSNIASVHEAVEGVYELIDRNQQAGGTLTGDATGFRLYDEKSGGLQKSNLVIIAADTSMGKTSLALNMVMNAGCPVAVYSMEMKKEQVAARMLAVESGVPANEILYSRLTQRQIAWVDKGVSRVVNRPVYFDDRSTSGIDTILASIRMMKLRYGIHGAVVDYLPSPLDIPAIKGVKVGTEEEIERKATDDSPLAALAFKIMNDPFVGSLTFVRIYSGVVESGTYVQNTVKEKRERVGRMLLMHANSREEIKEARAGDIVAIAGLKDTTTGDTLCDTSAASQVILERMEFPEPVIEVAVEPKSKADQEKMGIALSRLAAEDPSFRVTSDAESGQTVIKGMGELHLEIIVDRMKREFKVDANVGAPQVAYRETISKKYEEDYTHKKQSGGSGQFARVKLVFEPGETGSGFVFENKVVGGSVPKEYIPGVEKGLRSAMDNGVLAGFPLIDWKATLIDGAYHDVDSSVLAFEIAARAAFREGIAKAGPKLLEPMMKVEVVTPEDYMGDVIGDLNSRRGQINGMDQRGNAHVVSAMVPLANMFGYVNTLRSMSQGRAQYTMTFDHYSEVPAAVAEEIRAKLAG